MRAQFLGFHAILRAGGTQDGLHEISGMMQILGKVRRFIRTTPFAQHGQPDLAEPPVVCHALPNYQASLPMASTGQPSIASRHWASSSAFSGCLLTKE